MLFVFSTKYVQKFDFNVPYIGYLYAISPKINFFEQKICEQHDEIKYKLVADFLLKKRNDKESDEYLSQFNLPHNTFGDPANSKYGQYHASRELLKYISENDYGFLFINAIEGLYNLHSIFEDTPYIIKNMCCGGKGFKYRIIE